MMNYERVTIVFSNEDRNMTFGINRNATNVVSNEELKRLINWFESNDTSIIIKCEDCSMALNKYNVLRAIIK